MDRLMQRLTWMNPLRLRRALSWESTICSYATYQSDCYFSIAIARKCSTRNHVIFASNPCNTKIHTYSSHTNIQSSKNTLQFNFNQVAITIESAVQLIT